MSKLAERYQSEWAIELQRRGITPNGETYDERRQQAELAQARAYKLPKRKTADQALKAAAKAWAKARTNPAYYGAFYVGERVERP